MAYVTRTAHHVPIAAFVAALAIACNGGHSLACPEVEEALENDLAAPPDDASARAALDNPGPSYLVWRHDSGEGCDARYETAWLALNSDGEIATIKARPGLYLAGSRELLEYEPHCTIVHHEFQCEPWEGGDAFAFDVPEVRALGRIAGSSECLSPWDDSVCTTSRRSLGQAEVQAAPTEASRTLEPIASLGSRLFLSDSHLVLAGTDEGDCTSDTAPFDLTIGDRATGGRTILELDLTTGTLRPVPTRPLDESLRSALASPAYELCLDCLEMEEAEPAPGEQDPCIDIADTISASVVTTPVFEHGRLNTRVHALAEPGYGACMEFADGSEVMAIVDEPWPPATGSAPLPPSGQLRMLEINARGWTGVSDEVAGTQEFRQAFDPVHI